MVRSQLSTLFRGLCMNRLVAGLSCIVLGGAASWADINIDDLSGIAYTDIGHLMAAESGDEYENYYLHRFGVLISAEKIIEERLRLRVGVGGLFWQTFPRDPRAFHTNFIRFGPGVNEASGQFAFNEDLDLKFGYFDYKYGDSRNLGEYLLRSESYPIFLRTGDNYTWVDSAFSRGLGTRLRWDLAGGKFRQELGIFMEYQTAPLFDITPTYIATLAPVSGLEIGGGVALRRILRSGVWNQSRDENGSSRDPFAQYVEINNFPEVQHQAKIVFSTAAGLDSATAVWRPGAAFDEASFLAARQGTGVVRRDVIQDGSPAGMRSGIKGYLLNLAHCDADGENCETYLSESDSLLAVDAAGQVSATPIGPAAYSKTVGMTNQAINLMARASLDFNALLDLPENWGPFRLFGEVALLGVENQPVYYEDRMDRVPMLAGIHVPTFGLLDLLSVEVEYCRNPYVNGNANASKEYILAPDGLDQEARRFVKPSNEKDDVNWSVQATRGIVPGLLLRVQVANDHMRMLNWQGEYKSYDALLNQPEHWYYVAHLQWGF